MIMRSRPNQNENYTLDMRYYSRPAIKGGG